MYVLFYLGKQEIDSDSDMPIIPRVGDFINFNRSGLCKVKEVHWHPKFTGKQNWSVSVVIEKVVN